MDNTGLILGIDLENEFSQVCYYDLTSHTPESIPFIGLTVILENPVPLEKIFENVKQGMPVDMDELVSLVAFIIENAKRVRNCDRVDKVCVTVDDFNITRLDALKVAFERLQYQDDRISFISHEECYAYYAYSQRKELWNGGVLLLDYGVDKISGYVLTKFKGNDIILEESIETVNENLSSVITGQKTLDQVDSILVDVARQMLNQKIISSVYLTGVGFDTDQLPSFFLQTICNKRKVFVGQNLYVKGACYCAYEEITNMRFGDTIFACKNRITTGIEIAILERGMKKILRVVKAGTNWYEATRTLDFIVDDCNEVVLRMIPVAGREPYNEVIDIGEFPYRADKMTRISMNFVFAADDRCMLSIRDKGFGEIARSSGKVIYRDIAL